MDDAVWDPTVFTKNRDRMLESDIAKLFFQAVVEEARVTNLLSDEHFSVDGTLIEAWASQKSFQKKGDGESGKPGDGGNVAIDFHGEQRRTTRMNRKQTQTHVSTERAQGKRQSFAMPVTL